MGKILGAMWGNLDEKAKAVSVEWYHSICNYTLKHVLIVQGNAFSNDSTVTCQYMFYFVDVFVVSVLHLLILFEYFVALCEEVRRSKDRSCCCLMLLYSL